MIWRAVADSGAVITRFDMGHSGDDGIRFEPNLFIIPDHQLSRYQTALGNLKDVKLNIDLDTPKLRWYLPCFPRFLACCARLETLTLDFALANDDDEVGKFLQACDRQVEPGLPALKELFVSDASCVDPDLFRGFLLLFKSSLKSVHFRKLELTSSWDETFHFFRRQLSLTHLCLTACTVEGEYGILLARRSALEPAGSCQCPHMITFEGTEGEMDEYLSTLPDRMVVMKIEEDEDEDESEAISNDEDDDEDGGGDSEWEDESVSTGELPGLVQLGVDDGE